MKQGVCLLSSRLRVCILSSSALKTKSPSGCHSKYPRSLSLSLPINFLYSFFISSFWFRFEHDSSNFEIKFFKKFQTLVSARHQRRWMRQKQLSNDVISAWFSNQMNGASRPWMGVNPIWFFQETLYLSPVDHSFPFIQNKPRSRSISDDNKFKIKACRILKGASVGWLVSMNVKFEIDSFWMLVHESYSNSPIKTP